MNWEGFTIGLIAGVLIGAGLFGLVMMLAP
jgi:hypothetical protein